MLTKKDIFDNWIEHYMCGDYHLANKWTCSNKYVMPLSKEIYNAFGQAKVFSILDLRSGYHYLPLRDDDKVNNILGN
jgi:hypothetical protein